MDGSLPNMTPFEALTLNLDDLLTEARNWADGEPVATQDQADAVAALIDQINQGGKALEAERVAEKKPLDDAIKAIQDRYNVYLAPLTNKAVKGKVPLAVEALRAAVRPFLLAKEAELEEQRRRAREEAEAKAREAAEAARAAAASDLTAKEAAEAIQREAEAAAKAAEEEARANAEAAARAEREAAERAHAEALAAEKRRADEAEAARKAEADRIARETAAREAEEKAAADAAAARAADIEHRTKIMGAAKQAIMGHGVGESTARAIILAIAAGDVPNVSIKF